jgi:UDP-glucose:(heptosyl)LPS alpha-1,3-glucosyltransferase
MKLAFAIFRYFPFGGLQLDFARFLKEGISRGHTVTVLYDRWEGEFIPGAEYVNLKCRGLTNWGRALDFETQARSYCREHPFDRIVGFNRMGGLDWYYAADNPFAEHVREKNMLVRMLPRYRVFERLEKAVFDASGSTRILYLTEAQKKSFQQFYGTGNDRFRYLPPGVAPQFCLRKGPVAEQIRSRIRVEFDIPDFAVLLVQVCSAFRTKGVDRVLESVSRLSPAVREKVVYLVAGNDEPGDFLNLAKNLGIADRVIFAGPRQDVPDLLTAADLMVHPARNEATGTVLAEAAVCGLPAICSSVCGYAPLIRSAGGIVLPEPFTVQSLTDALELTLRMPDALPRMCQDVRSFAAETDFYHRTELFWKFIEE